MSLGPIEIVGLIVFAAFMCAARVAETSWLRSSLVGCLALGAHYAFWNLGGMLAERATGDPTGPSLLAVGLLLLEPPACAFAIGAFFLVLKLVKRKPAPSASR